MTWVLTTLPTEENFLHYPTKYYLDIKTVLLTTKSGITVE
jgi:hypothetical protein